ncbi:hypothetical protein NEFER03_0233 [Nematocida sp. LUAm3]|nr:hypothetical protein NEFER03_0233 [Nematocida sp. LUAm3]KAI5173686.1 hypothetical protein NEFER02_0202 [Nematocida sp. LUAm2]KAI5176907.1 hypothetical protein NEFER01_0232 [Nematocida sp. LUAm1]
MKHIRKLHMLKNEAGEPSEYEEYFKKAVEECIANNQKQEAYTSLLHLLDPSRSNIILECAIKAIDVLDVEEIPPNIIKKVLERGQVMELYSIHLQKKMISRDSNTPLDSNKLISEKNTEYLNEVMKIFKEMLSSQKMGSFSCLSLLSFLFSFSFFRLEINRFLSEKTISLHHMRLLAYLVHVHGLDDELIKYSTEYGKKAGGADTFLSREAASLLWMVSLKSNRRIDGLSFFSVETLENYLLHGFPFFSEALQKSILSLLEAEEQDKIPSLFLPLKFSDEYISKRTIRAILAQCTSYTLLFSEHMEAILFSSEPLDDARKDLSHLWDSPCKHSHMHCMEI